MRKMTVMLGLCVVMVCGAANAATSQVVTNAKTACQNNPTQCSNAKSAAKNTAKKETQAAKDACSKNQSMCDGAKSKAKSAVSAQ